MRAVLSAESGLVHQHSLFATLHLRAQISRCSCRSLQQGSLCNTIAWYEVLEVLEQKARLLVARMVTVQSADSTITSACAVSYSCNFHGKEVGGQDQDSDDYDDCRNHQNNNSKFRHAHHND